MNTGLTVVIPVYNEAEIIRDNTARLQAYLDGLGGPYELLLVSNGSVDRTPELGGELAGADPRVRFFELAERGVGRAFALAVDRAAYDRIVSVDMDLSVDLDFIPQAAALLDDYHIVVGSKKMGSQKRAFWRKAGSMAFILTARLLLSLSFEDYSIAAKAYRREVILRYLDRLDYGTSYVLDLIYHTRSEGGRALEIPVYCEDFRPSKFNLVNEALYRFRNLFRLWWNYRIRPGRS
ncbi:MAG: glycosyltransferase family 2 protein [Proteobacteria bacterium]|nr:glycosyltransferase family 2 protein [Pseudomonadota bacterium]